ncbi:MAG: phospho-N-acetylmuramoyl-pentapeptide-transferase [Myxococcota bacterium]|nr:phospho-N-acetylmuramoyl-pentapeptide-transferase [Myxococcota bacterium]
MLYFLADQWLKNGGPPLFTYITSRALFGFFTAFFLSLVLGRPIIKWLFLKGFRDYPRNFGNIAVGSKSGTPTMGGVIVAVSAFFSILMWSDLTNPRIWLILFSMLVFGLLGYWDDNSKRVEKSAEGGISRIKKLIPQFLFGIIMAACVFFPEAGFFNDDNGHAIYIPFIKDPIVHIYGGIFVLGFCWSIGVTNAVNYTDGLDGLLIVPAFFCFLVLALFSYVHGNKVIAEYLHYPYFVGVGELTVICSIYMGCCLGFLWFNAFPAEVFMGDFGSLMIGGVLMTISFLIREEVIFLIVGGVIVFEFLSSAVQDYYFIKLRGMRFFRQAPFHRSLKNGHGIAEPKVVVRYWIVSAVVAAIAIITLKVR